MPATPLTPNDRSPESMINAEAQTLREENKDLKRRLEAAEAIIHGYSQHETEGYDTSKFFDNETSEDANFARRGKDIDQRQLCFEDLEDDVDNCAANSAVLEESRGENTAEAPALSQVDTCATNSGILEESSGKNADATEAKKGDESKSAALTFFAQNQCDSQRKILEWTNPWGDHSELIVDDFVRLLDGRWLSDRLINWHVVYLYEAAHKRGIHVETTYFASKLLSECSSTGNLFCVTISLTSYLCNQVQLAKTHGCIFRNMQRERLNIFAVSFIQLFMLAIFLRLYWILPGTEDPGFFSSTLFKFMIQRSGAVLFSGSTTKILETSRRVIFMVGFKATMLRSAASFCCKTWTFCSKQTSFFQFNNGQHSPKHAPWKLVAVLVKSANKHPTSNNFNY